MKARLGVIGTGWWATFNHIPTIAAGSDAEVVAICDIDAERLKIAGEHFGIEKRFTDVGEMLASEALDGVMISTPHIAHAGATLAALTAGCHALVEKPMATNAADGRLIVEAASKANKQVLVPCGLNFADFTLRAATMVREGRIGVVQHAVCQMSSALYDLFAGEPMLETADHMFRPPASTWADPNRAGGYGWGQMSHSLAWLFYVSDLKIESVFCLDGKSKAGVDLFDAAVARATNGATVSLSGSAALPKQASLHCDIRIYGDEGCLLFDTERGRLDLIRRDGKDETHPISAKEAAYDGARPVRKFAEICAGKPVINTSDAECGARVTETLDALYRSARTGVLERVGG